MNNTRTLPVAAAAVTAPAWLPTLATIAPPLIIGAGIVAALVWLFSDDEKPKADDAAPPAKPSPAPDAKHVGAGWFEYDPPAAPTPAPAMTEAERLQRTRDNEAEIARTRREMKRLDSEIAATEAKLRDARTRPAAAAVTPQANAVAPVRPQLASPATTIAAAPISAPRSPVPAPPQAPPVTHQATPAPAVAVAAPVPVTLKPTPGKFQLFAPKVHREDLAAIFANGKRLARKAAVAALAARGVKQTTAYNALRDGGRFAAVLDVGEDGLLAFKG
jgi:hypothetical protein